MQTDLLCLPIKAGDSTPFPGGDKTAGKGVQPSDSNPENSFPMALHEMSAGTDPESTGDGPRLSSVLSGHLASSVGPQQLCETAPNASAAVDADIDRFAGIGEAMENGAIRAATASGAAAPPPAAPQQGTANPLANSEAVAPAPPPLDSAGRQTGSGNFAPGDSVTVDTDDFDPAGARESAVRNESHGRSVSTAAVGPKAGDLVKGVVSASAGPGAGEWRLGDQHRSDPASRARPSQAIPQDTKPSDSGDTLDSRSHIPPERSQPGLSAAARRVQHPSATAKADRAPAAEALPSAREATANGSEPVKTGTAAEPVQGASDRVASEMAQAAPDRTAPDLNVRPPAAAAGENRLSVTAADPQALMDEQVKMDKPHPTEIIDQIVKKAVIRYRGGFSEARIDLKPETLGHLRLQISTENQQVTLRILTEHPLVKEIIESGAAQLKADLLNQGLQMEQLEVGVNGDRDRLGRQPDHADRPPQGMSDDTRDAVPAADHPDEGTTSAASVGAIGKGVDTFV